MLFDLAGQKIWIAGHRGMVGSALVRRLGREDCEILTVGREELDLRDQQAVLRWLERNRPDAIVLAAAKVGGILANDSEPVPFLLDNLLIETAVMAGAHHVGVKKLLFLGSSCIYPRLAEQPITEDALLTGPLEPTNEWYAIAKIAGIKLAQAYRKQFGRDFICAMPTNLYGPGDNFDLGSSHVLPALMRKAHEARLSGADHFTIWGSGKALREFLHVDDLADACVFLLQHYSESAPINVGSGLEITIHALAMEMAQAVGFAGEIRLDLTKPDGTPRKLMSQSKMQALGWAPRIGLAEGIAQTYAWFLAQGG